MIKEIPDNIKDKLYTLEVRKETIEKEITKCFKDYSLLNKFQFEQRTIDDFDSTDDEILFFNYASELKTKIRVNLRMLNLVNILLNCIYEKCLLKNGDNKNMFYTKIAIYNLQNSNIDLEEDFIKQNIKLTHCFF